jgi:hypothetical protein
VPYDLRRGKGTNTFANTANVENRLLFADQGKQNSVFPFLFQKQTEVIRFRFPYCIYLYIEMAAYTSTVGAKSLERAKKSGPQKKHLIVPKKHSILIFKFFPRKI